MKLNLLPADISRTGRSKSAWVLMGLISLVGIGAAFLLIFTSQKSLEKAKADAEQYKAAADEVARIASQADAQVTPQVTSIFRNVELVKAMNAHNRVYPDFYDQMLPSVPSFFRLTSIDARPVDQERCTVAMVGVLKTYQQYADVMLAFLRHPDAISITRSGFEARAPYVPQITEQDQQGVPIDPNRSQVPQDPLARLDYYIAQSAQEGYVGVSNFGSEGTAARGPMPDYSQVTINLVMKHNLQAPDPIATLRGTAANENPNQGGGERRRRRNRD